MKSLINKRYRSSIAKFGRVGALLLGLLAGSAQASDYAQEWGPKVGTSMPALSAADQTGEVRSLTDLSGENGLLILFNRSADW